MGKDADEIVLIKESALITEAVLKTGMESSRVGVLESEIIKAVEIEVKRFRAIKEVQGMC
ncbi:hypothetical protein ACFLVB_05435 [Chloroflexota bacterium]